MENKENVETFKMTYSAEQQEEIQSIRNKYAPKEESKIEQLRALDTAVNRKATTRSVAVGVIGTLIMGVGMSLAMSELGSALGAAALPAGVVIGTVGIAVLALAYPLYNRTLRVEREKVAPEILRLTDELMR